MMKQNNLLLWFCLQHANQHDYSEHSRTHILNFNFKVFLFTFDQDFLSQLKKIILHLLKLGIKSVLEDTPPKKTQWEIMQKYATDFSSSFHSVSKTSVSQAYRNKSLVDFRAILKCSFPTICNCFHITPLEKRRSRTKLFFKIV